MESNPVRRASVAVDLAGDEVVHNVSAFDFTDEGQAQVMDAEGRWTLHIAGTPESWWHLASKIADAAAELKRQLAAAQVTAS